MSAKFLDDHDVAALHHVAATAGGQRVTDEDVRTGPLVQGPALSGPLRRTSMFPLRTVLPQIWTTSLVRSGSMSSITVLLKTKNWAALTDSTLPDTLEPVSMKMV